MLVRNLSRGNVLVADLAVADRFWPRLRGLIGRPALGEDQGLWLEPCGSVHTWFMRRPIDVAFLDRDRQVLRVVSELRPWRAARAPGASAALELPAGRARRAGLNAGDRLGWEG